MNKGLEELERIKNINWFAPKEAKSRLKDFYDFTIIEKDLKDYYSNKVLIENIDSNKVAFLPSDELKALIDKGQALKIIIKNEVNIYVIKITSNYKEYNTYVDDYYVLNYREGHYLTKDEFNSIKEAISQWED